LYITSPSGILRMVNKGPIYAVNLNGFYLKRSIPRNTFLYIA